MIYNNNRVRIIRREDGVPVAAQAREDAPGAAASKTFAPMCAYSKPHGVSQAMLDNLWWHRMGFLPPRSLQTMAKQGLINFSGAIKSRYRDGPHPPKEVGGLRWG